MQRPRGVTWTTGLMAFFLVFGLVHSFFVPLPMPTTSLRPHAHHFDPVTLHLFVYGFVVFEAACVAFYYKGEELGRRLVLLDSAFQIINLLHWLRSFKLYPAMALLGLTKAALAVFLVWYLFQPKVRAWFNGPLVKAIREEYGPPQA